MNRVLPVLALLAALCAATACGKKKPAAKAAPAAASGSGTSVATRSPGGSPAMASTSASEFYWIRADVVVRKEPRANAPALAALRLGERVPLGPQTAAPGGNGTWMQLVGPGIAGGWIPSSATSRTRVAPPPAPEKPRVVSTGGTGTIHRAGKDAALIDHRALDAEKAREPEAAKPPRDPADDLATLQSLVDEMYLDPTTWQPSAERRRRDAAEFRKGLE